jgi:hypothetical protein
MPCLVKIGLSVLELYVNMRVAVVLGGAMVIILGLDLRFEGSNPTESDGLFKGDKNP